MDRGFKLFGVRVSESPSSPSTLCSSSAVAAVMIRKSLSMGNLSSYGEASSTAPPSDEQQNDLLGESLDGYASDDLVHTNSSSRERKKGIPWTEEEHRLFLLGLQKLGKGDWRGISQNFVKSRTPTQVASHAQKHFLRRSNLNKRRRRSSLFDITADEVSSLHEELASEELGFEPADVCSGVHDIRSSHGFSFSDSRREAALLSTYAYPVGGFPIPLKPFPRSCLPMSVPEIAEEVSEEGEVESMEGCETGEVRKDTPSADISAMDLVPDGNDQALNHHLGPPFPLFPMWSGPGLPWPLDSKVLKPTPIIPTPSSLAAAAAEDSTNLSESSYIGSSRPVMEPTPLSYKLLQEGSRYSAFHSTSSVGSSEL